MKETNPFSQDLSYLMWRISIIWEREAERAFGDESFSLTQYYVLMAIKSLPEPFIQNDIRLQMEIDKVTVHKCISKFKDQNWVNIVDGKRIRLTRSGDQAFKKYRRQFEEVRQRFFQGMNLEEASRFIYHLYNQNILSKYNESINYHDFNIR